MSYFNARRLLFKVARYSELQSSTYSRLEISKRLNEIKYLAGQKKVPKLTIRKEIIHLENEMSKVKDLEDKLAIQKKREKLKIAVLKRQNTILKKKLALTQNKDVHKQVEKLSHLIGDSLAQKEAKRDVHLSRRVAEDMKNALIENEKRKLLSGQQQYLEKENVRRAKIITARIKMLKQELEMYKTQEKDASRVAIIEQQLTDLENKLQAFYEKYPELIVQELREVKVEKNALDEEIKHNMMFAQPIIAPVIQQESDDDMESERELPLPPPPKIRA